MYTDEDMQKEERASGYVRKEWLAEHFKTSQRQIQRWRSDGALVTENTKWGQRYHLLKSLDALCKFLMARQDEKGEKQRALTADADYKERKAELLKIELRKRKGEVHEARHVQEFTTTMILEIKAAMLAIPGRISVDLFACKSENEINALLRREICAVMEELANHEYTPEQYRQRQEEDGDINADLDEEEETK